MVPRMLGVSDVRPCDQDSDSVKTEAGICTAEEMKKVVAPYVLKRAVRIEERIIRNPCNHNIGAHERFLCYTLFGFGSPQVKMRLPEAKL